MNILQNLSNSFRVNTSMNLNSTNTSLNKTAFIKNQTYQPIKISFGSDRFQKSTVPEYTILENNNAKVVKGIEKRLEDVAKAFKNDTLTQLKGISPLGNGYEGNVFIDKKLGLTYKFSHKVDSTNSEQHHKAGCDFKNETNILKRVSSNKSNSQRLIARLKIDDNSYCLITTFVKGNKFGKTPITDDHLRSALNEMYNLDKAGILHCDLRDENVLTTDNKVGFIDFGAGYIFDRFITPFKEFWPDEFYQNPSFSPPANIRFFDSNAIFPYLNKLMTSESPTKARQFFENYLVLRADYHQKRADLLKDKLNNHIKDNNITQKQHKELQEAIEYENLQAKLLKKNDKDIVDIELLKIQLDKDAHFAAFNQGNYGFSARKIGLEGIRNMQNSVLSALEKDDISPEKQKFLNYQLRFSEFYLNEAFLPRAESIYAELMKDKPNKKYDIIAILDKIDFTQPDEYNDIAKKLS